MGYGDFEDLSRRTASDKVLVDKAFNLAKSPKFDGCQCGIASAVHKFLDKKSASDKGTGINFENQQLADKLHQPFTKKIRKRKVYSSFTDNIWVLT